MTSINKPPLWSTRVRTTQKRDTGPPGWTPCPECYVLGSMYRGDLGQGGSQLGTGMTQTFLLSPHLWHSRTSGSPGTGQHPSARWQRANPTTYMPPREDHPWGRECRWREGAVLPSVTAPCWSRWGLSSLLPWDSSRVRLRTLSETKTLWLREEKCYFN